MTISKRYKKFGIRINSWIFFYFFVKFSNKKNKKRKKIIDVLFLEKMSDKFDGMFDVFNLKCY